MSDGESAIRGAVHALAAAALIAGAARAAGKPGEVTIFQAPQAVFLRLRHPKAPPIKGVKYRTWRRGAMMENPLASIMNKTTVPRRRT